MKLIDRVQTAIANATMPTAPELPPRIEFWWEAHNSPSDLKWVSCFSGHEAVQVAAWLLPYTLWEQFAQGLKLDEITDYPATYDSLRSRNRWFFYRMCCSRATIEGQNLWEVLTLDQRMKPCEN
ncbi:MAG: hypothetical protein J0M33_23780 [Anaerolineae bacterium]|nr:hypothetical protein [Anaerolineae bacterium]